MLTKSKFKAGEIHPMFLNYKQREAYLGEAELLEYIEEGLTFYDDQKTSNGQFSIYSSEKWRVKFTESQSFPKGFEKVLNIRKLLYFGTDRQMISKLTTYKSQVDILQIQTTDNMALIGTTFMIKKEVLGLKKGDIVVVFNVYPGGVQVIGPNGDYDGFSDEEQEEFFEDKTGFVSEVSGYQFRNVMQVSHDFEIGYFDPVWKGTPSIVLQ